MSLGEYLRKLLVAYVDDYINLFAKTLGIALTFTLLCFVCVLVLVKFNDNNYALDSPKPISLLSYFYLRYSKAGVYSIVDLSKIIYLFFISLMSIGIWRISKSENNTQAYISTSDLFASLKWTDLMILSLILIIVSALDYAVVQLDSLISLSQLSQHLRHYLHSALFFNRIYFPVLMFSMAIYRANIGQLPRLNFVRFMLLLIAFWSFNEFSYESFLFVRLHIFDLILIPFSDQNSYIVESLLGIFLMALYFVGYFVAMSRPYSIFEEKGGQS
jgi:hypothetical protein